MAEQGEVDEMTEREREIHQLIVAEMVERLTINGRPVYQEADSLLLNGDPESTAPLPSGVLRATRAGWVDRALEALNLIATLILSAWSGVEILINPSWPVALCIWVGGLAVGIQLALIFRDRLFYS